MADTTAATTLAPPTPNIHVIALSPNYATGLLIGIFLIMMAAFAVYSMLSIQTSDKMALPDTAYALPERKEE